ncbi:MAG: hypothetical protein R3220_03240 [Balneolaceae bacterium]|nr:hypothetical protein [Balneolaceae bacterium]
MEQISEQITEGLIEKLPKEADFFTPQELLSSGVPAIVVETLRKTVASTIESGMNLPASDWVQTDSENVLTAWHAFVEVSKRHVKIPSSKITYLLGEAVEKCLELAIRPRQSVPKVLLKSQRTIDLETTKKRVADLEVNQQLGLALLRYMEKKDKSELTFKQVRELIKKIDEKLVEDYHPLNWAKALKPVFELAGPAVDSDYIRMFFEDKEMHGAARKFDLLEKEINESDFIEIMSSAELLGVGDPEDTQPQLFVSDEEEETEAGTAVEDEDDSKTVEGEEDEPEFESSIEGDKDLITVDDEDDDEEEPAEIEDNTETEKYEQEIEQEDTEEPNEEEETEIETGQDELEKEVEQSEENIVDLFSEIQHADDEDELYYLEKEDSGLSLVEDEETDEQEDNITLLNKFMFDDSHSETDEPDEGSTEDAEEDSNEEGDEDEAEGTSEVSEKKEPSSIYEEMNLVKESRNRTERMAETFDDSTEEEKEEKESDEGLSYQITAPEEEQTDETEEEDLNDTEIETDDIEEESDEEELPMWRSFLERDELETESGYEYEEESEEEELVDEEGFIEEPIYDLTVTEEDPEEKIKDVSKWLDDEKDRFIEEIFRNSEMAYEQALIEIMDFEDWKSASHYLENEVFSRNRINVYDEAAVDFTDRLHSYFMEYKS